MARRSAAAWVARDCTSWSRRKMPSFAFNAVKLGILPASLRRSCSPRRPIGRASLFLTGADSARRGPAEIGSVHAVGQADEPRFASSRN